jgi:hypothetical protein
MYVVTHEKYPDVVYEKFENVVEQLHSTRNSVAYKYVCRENVWYATSTYFVFENNVMVQDGLSIPNQYVKYKFPNICSICNLSKYMFADECSYCEERCHDCYQIITNCYCPYNDY